MTARARTAPISGQLRAALTAPGRTPHAVAVAAGVAPSAVTRFVNGDRGLTTETLDRLADALGLRLVDTGRRKAARRRGGAAGTA
jgi:plasmid maintenance system antidote protein VapI